MHLHLIYLTPRETEVVRLLAAGFIPSDIAMKLRIEPSTVYTHLNSIREKVDCTSLLELATKVARKDLVVYDSNRVYLR